MNKQRIVYDRTALKGEEEVQIKKKKGGYVTAINHETGEVIFKQLPNMITTAGSAFAAAKIWNITPDIWLQTVDGHQLLQQGGGGRCLYLQKSSEDKHPQLSIPCL